MRADLDHYFSGFLKIHPEDGITSLAPTGEPFVTITLSLVKPEGEIEQILALSERAATALLELRIKQYAEGSCGTVYWRTNPEVGSEVMWRQDFDRQPVLDRGHPQWPMSPVLVWRGYARLLISDKPVLAAEVA